jgi:putative NADH-flavin reductase
VTKAVVFGANGSTGREVVKACQALGYDVVAAVRRPETISDLPVRTAKVDIARHESLLAAMDGADVVVSCLGHGGLKASAQPTTLYSDSIRAYRAAMREAGIRRIMVLSSGGTVQDDAAPWFYTKLIRRYLLNTYLDMARMETILEESQDLEWTVVRLTYLLKGPSKPVIAAEGRIGRGNFKIHFVDAAQFIAKDITKRDWINKHVVIGYDK